jgi:DNA-binding SARP family transcriptional activator/DNA-binding beta-propeller fold protein YncE
MNAARGDEEAARIHFGVLGPLEVTRDGAPIDLGPRKQRAVLAILLLSANRVVPTARLIDDLWGDAPPETARSALQVYIAGLRKALGEGGAALTTRAPGYLLAVDNGALDVDRFVALRDQARASGDVRRKAALLHEALELWRGVPLAELDGEPFAAAARLHLEELRLGALEERIDADLELGRHAQLVPELDALAADHPYRERLRGQQMLALYRSGRQADALAAYRAAREASVEDLGLEPGPELKALERAMLDQDPRLDAPTVEEAAAVAAPARRRRRIGLSAALAALLVGLVVTVVLVLDREPAPIVAPPNSVAIIDVGSRRVVDTVQVGIRPGPMAVDGTTLWIGNRDDKTVARIDTRTRAVGKYVSVPATPEAIAFGAGQVWVVHARLGSLSVIDPQFDRASGPVQVARQAVLSSTGGVDVGEGSVWAAFGDATLRQIDPRSAEETGWRYVGPGPSAVLVAYGSVWVSSVGDSSVLRYHPRTWLEAPVSRPLTVGRGPRGLAAGAGSIWVATEGDDTVWRIAASTISTSSVPIRVGDGPIAVAYGAGAVWTANNEDGTVSRIDPESEAVTSIDVGGAPSGIAVVGDEVWVAVEAS